MRIYVIGNNGITLCREPLATVTEGEIAVTSKEKLQAAPLSSNGCWRCGTLCLVSKSAEKSVTARRWSTSCGRQLKPCPTRNRNPTRNDCQNRAR